MRGPMPTMAVRLEMAQTCTVRLYWEPLAAGRLYDSPAERYA